MEARLLDLALETPGFMPQDEGLALYEAGRAAGGGVWVEIGSYCGRSAIFLGAAARETGALLVTIDHHQGSEEHQPGEAFHDERLVDRASGVVDTLPHLARTLRRAALGDVVLPVAARSAVAAAAWHKAVTLVFIDGSHSDAAAHADLDGWTPHLSPGGMLVIHDVFPDPAQGGRPPYEIYRRARARGFRETAATGSLRILRRP